MNFWSKYLIKKIIRYSYLYKRTYKSLLASEGSDAAQENKMLNRIIEQAVTHVAYYRNLNIHSNSAPGISDFKILRKNDLAGHEQSFLSEKYRNKKLIKISTSGTTGGSINLHNSIKSVVLETAFIDYIVSKIDSPENLRFATLRGNKPQKGIFEYKYGHLLLSAYDLSLENVKLYIELIKKYRINCLHVYPSTIRILCKRLEVLKDSIEIPYIKGIYSSSEILSLADKKLIMNTFKNTTLIDEYGQNEHVALGFAINNGYFHFLSKYSFVEFIDTGKTCNKNKVSEIVGTCYINEAMPLIRYATQDYVEINQEGNIVSIIGRTQDFVVNNENEMVPCMVLTRNNTLKNVISAQYFQNKPGVLEYRTIVSSNFNKKDKEAIAIDICKAFGGKIIPTVTIVEEIERTKSGKQKRLIQKLDLSLYQ